MKRKCFFSLLLLLLTLSLAACGGTNAEGEKGKEVGEDAYKGQIDHSQDILKEIRDRGYLRVACKDDVPGFGFYNEETGTYEGGEIRLAYRIAAKIFKVGYEEAVSRELVHFIPVKVEERESILMDQQADYVIATYTITEERAKQVDFSKSYYSSAVGLMVKQVGTTDSSLREESIRSIGDLDGKRIGVPRGATTRAAFLDYLEKNSVPVTPVFMEYSSYDAMDQALEDGLIDVFCVDVTILNGYLKPGRVILADRFSQQEYGVAAGKGHQCLVDIANEAIEEMEKDFL